MLVCRAFLRIGLPLLAFVAFGCNRGQAQQAGEQPKPLVTAVGVTVTNVPYYIDEIGRCAASSSVSLMPQVAGRVDSADFVEGADVKKGDLLFTIDPRPFQAAVAQSEAALNQSRENLKLAQAEFSRVEALKGTSAVSQTEYDQKKSAVAVADAQREAAQANLDTAKLNLEYCAVKSPIDGRTGMRMVDPGNVVKANENALVMVQSFDPMYVEFTIPEDRLAEVRSNMADGELKALVDFALPRGTPSSTTQPMPQPATQPASQPSDIQPPHEGVLSMVDNSVQASTGTVRLRASMPNADRYFWPGQFVHVRLVLFEKKNALLIPSQAIQIGQQGPYVYVIKHDDEKKSDVAEMRPVVQGQMQGDLVVIDKGLSPEDKVIVTGQLMVVPNAPVSVAPAQNPAQVAEARS